MISEGQVHDQLAFHGLSKDDRDAWWDEPLPELGDRTPAQFFKSDPKAVFLCAKYGFIGDTPRFTPLTPERLWPDDVKEEAASFLQESVRGDIVHTSHRGEAGAAVFTPELSAPRNGHKETPAEPEPDPIFEGVRDQVMAERKPSVPDWWA